MSIPNPPELLLTTAMNLSQVTSRRISPRSIQDQLHQMLCELEHKDCTLFHLTTTYRPYQDRIYKESDLSKFFTNFYLKTLLPDLFQTRTWTKIKKLNQPVVLSFLDEHEIKAIPTGNDQKHNLVYSYPIRLHHHSIIASRPYTRDFFKNSVGVNTFLNYSSKFMTTDLKQCDADRVYYASKLLWKYPDYLMFGYY